MKNKNIIKVMMIIFISTLIGCSDFLEEDARGLLTPDNFFQNEDEALLALNGLQGGVGLNGIYSHLGTDIGVSGRFAIAGGWQSAVYNYSPSTAQVGWGGQYTRIRNANLVLAGVEASSLSDEVKGSTRAQTLFYRADAYLRLVTLYEDVPYWRNEVIIEEVSLLGTTDGTIILEEMITDLDEAISSGYLSTSKWNENTSRPTVWAARMLKAYIHIWLEQWTEARAELIEVTANSPHQLNPDYIDMYREGNELHDEIIFGREYLTGTSNNRAFEQFRPNANAETTDARDAFNEIGLQVRSSARTMRKSFAITYDENDARKRYNVLDRYTFTAGDNAGTEVEFNWIYIPKRMRAALPIGDPIMQTPDPNGTSSEPQRILTLADAFLLLAEAEFMINGSSADALAAINTIRARTTLPDYTSITIQDIRNERGWELTSDGYWGRKPDLIRWGILESTVMGLPAAETAAGATQVAIDRAQVEADFITAGLTGQYLIYPVPLDDILKSQDIGGSLVQHPLWQ